MSVKVENIAEPICYGCLSSDRRTSPLRAYFSIETYDSLIGHLPLIPYNEVMLCWECRGMLGKLMSFRTQLITAQNLLQQALYKVDACVVPLSKLSVKTKIDYDCEFQHSDHRAESIEVIVEVKQEPNDVDDQEFITADDYVTHNNYDHDKKGNYLLETEIDVKHKLSAIGQPVDSRSVSVKKEPQEQEKKNHQNQSPSEQKHLTNIAYDCDTKSQTQKADIQTQGGLSDGNNCKCKYCSKILCNRSSLARHLRLHTGDLPYNCTLCTKTYCDKSSLDKHIQLHTGDKPHRCTFCQKRFTDNSSLVKHSRTHTGEKPYTCQQCDRSFARSGHLVLHIRTHTGEKPYTCPECNKNFSATSSLVTHMRTHTGERPFICEQCNKSFSEKGHLVTHIRTHTGERPYACEHCTKRFSDHSCYTNHLRVHSGVKPYGCRQCPKSFTQQSTLLSHIRTHTGEKPYACKMCDKKFSQSSSLGQHVKTHVDRHWRN